MSTRRINYSPKKRISCQKIQQDNNFLWVGFEKNSDDICLIEKQFAFEPSQIFFSLERTVDKIVKFDLNSTDLFVAYEDTNLLGEIISLNNPLTSTTEIVYPSGINEYPVDVLIQGLNLWFLLPGNLSGTNAQLLQYDLSGNLQQIIDLSDTSITINNASSFIKDDDDNLWILTNTDPVLVIRVFEISGNIWDFQTTEII